MTAETPFDPGLQAERTLLAWRRTALSLGVASAVALRLAAPEFGAVAVLIGVAALLLCFAVYVAVSARYRRAHTSLVQQEHLRTDGMTIAFVSAATFALSGLALVWLVSR